MFLNFFKFVMEGKSSQSHGFFWQTHIHIHRQEHCSDAGKYHREL